MPKSSPKSPKKQAKIEFLVDKERHFKRYVKYLSNPFHIMFRNFLAGTFHGVGFVLGSALFFGVLGVITSKILGSMPFFSELAQAIEIWLNNTVELRR